LDQVHGTDVLQLEPLVADGVVADGAFTSHEGLACTVMVADCLPVLLCDMQGHQVAAAHAGWRGLLGAQGIGVLERAVAAFDPIFRDAEPANRSTLLAWLGPCIGPNAFEVGDEVRAAFVAAAPSAAACFRPGAGGKWWADLPALARQRLAALGIARTFGNDGSDAWCTVLNSSRFFSHRRDGISGRLAACVWRVDR
jgi:YfiH family protein